MTPPTDPRETRSVEVQIEVPGTPEEVWEAIATGPGISSWFVPSEVEGREGGTVRQRHGADMDYSGTIFAWDPPRRFGHGDPGERRDGEVSFDGLADEFLVEARSGGTCIVRVVTSGFGSGAEWDEAIEGVKNGWGSALNNLRLYLEHFRGRPAASISLGGAVAGSPDEAWATLLDGLGLGEVEVGRHVTASGDGVPPLAGAIDRAGAGELTVVLEEPAPGVAALYAGGPHETTYAFVRLYLFGDDAGAIAAREEPAWRAWLAATFPGWKAALT
jgi:uncharacterized protein YndB with AHSA1/START domain